MSKFSIASKLILNHLESDGTENDLKHASNTQYWMLRLRPNASELLQLAALAHDIERAGCNPLSMADFNTYDEYKKAHADASARIVVPFLSQARYGLHDSNKIASIIRDAELPSTDPDIQLLCDADSVSFFDNNALDYLRRKGNHRTIYKVGFMYDRASKPAKKIIDDLVDGREDLCSMLHGLNIKIPR